MVATSLPPRVFVCPATYMFHLSLHSSTTLFTFVPGKVLQCQGHWKWNSWLVLWRSKTLGHKSSCCDHWDTMCYRCRSAGRGISWGRGRAEVEGVYGVYAWSLLWLATHVACYDGKSALLFLKIILAWFLWCTEPCSIKQSVSPPHDQILLGNLCHDIKGSYACLILPLIENGEMSCSCGSTCLI